MTRRFIRKPRPFAGVMAAAAAVVRTTAAHITKSATARIITSGTRDRKNAFARRVSNMPATARDTPAAREMPATTNTANANARRDTLGTRRPALVSARGRTGAQ